MVHNKYDNTDITFGNWGQYFDNRRPECFTHCYLNKCTADPNNNGGACNYLTLNKKTGTFTYDLRDPFYYTDVKFTCDNGFM